MDTCIKCKEDKIKGEDGICPSILDQDQLPLRCFGIWAKDKLYYLERYMSIFNTSMKNKWPTRIYIELFAGSGRGVIRESEEIIDGSPLKATKQSIPFSNHIFVDINPEALEALGLRIKSLNPAIDYRLIPGDCNACVDNIRRDIDSSCLALAFIDPTSMQIKFSTIESLTHDLRIDLIINFPLQAINRSYMYAMQGYDDKFNDFFGSKDWRDIISNASDFRSVGAKLLELYKNKLKAIGYGKIRDLSPNQYLEAGDVLVRGPKNIPLYYLVFASKSGLAYKFWNEVQKITANNQRRLL